jgi:hypothetical protein
LMEMTQEQYDSVVAEMKARLEKPPTSDRVAMTGKVAIDERRITQADYENILADNGFTPDLRHPDDVPMSESEADAIVEEIKGAQNEAIRSLRAVKAEARKAEVPSRERKAIDETLKLLRLTDTTDRLLHHMREVERLERDAAERRGVKPEHVENELPVWLTKQAHDILDREGAIPINMLPAQDIRAIESFLKMQMAQGALENKILVQRGRKKAVAVVSDVVDFLKGLVGGEKVDFIPASGRWERMVYRVFNIGSKDATTLIEILGGDDSSLRTLVVDGMTTAEHRSAELYKEAGDELADVVEASGIGKSLGLWRKNYGIDDILPRIKPLKRYIGGRNYGRLVRVVRAAGKLKTDWKEIQLDNSMAVNAVTGDPVQPVHRIKMTVENLMQLRQLWQRGVTHDFLLTGTPVFIDSPNKDEDSEMADLREYAIKMSVSDIKKAIAAIPVEADAYTAKFTELVRRLGPQVSKVFEELHGMPLNVQVDYWMSRRYHEFEKDQSDLMQRMEKQYLLDDNPHLKPIVGGSLPIDLRGGFTQQGMDYLRFASDYIGKAVPMANVMRVLNDPAFVGGAQAYLRHGDGILKNLKELLDVGMYGAQLDPVANALTQQILNSFTTVALGLKPNVIMNQGVSAIVEVIPAEEYFERWVKNHYPEDIEKVGRIDRYFSIAHGRAYWDKRDKLEWVKQYSHTIGERRAAQGRLSAMLTPLGSRPDPIDILTRRKEAFWMRPARRMDRVAIDHAIRSSKAFLKNEIGLTGDTLNREAALAAEYIIENSQAGNTMLHLPYISLKARQNPLLLGFAIFQSEQYHAQNLFSRARIRYERGGRTPRLFAKMLKTWVLGILLTSAWVYLMSQLVRWTYRGFRPSVKPTSVAGHAVNVALNVLSSSSPYGSIFAGLASGALGAILSGQGVQDQMPDDVLTGLMGDAGQFVGRLTRWTTSGAGRTEEQRRAMAGELGYDVSLFAGLLTNSPLAAPGILWREAMRADTKSPTTRRIKADIKQANQVRKTYKLISQQEGEMAAEAFRATLGDFEARYRLPIEQGGVSTDKKHKELFPGDWVEKVRHG